EGCSGDRQRARGGDAGRPALRGSLPVPSGGPTSDREPLGARVFTVRASASSYVAPGHRSAPAITKQENLIRSHLDGEEWTEYVESATSASPRGLRSGDPFALPPGLR